MTDQHPAEAIAFSRAVPLNSRHQDEEIMKALVVAGALVSLGDGRSDEAERDALIDFIERQNFVPTCSQNDIGDAFDHQLQQIKSRDGAAVIVEAFRPLAGLSLASIVIRTAERVAAADGKIYPGELRALKLVRLVMATLSTRRPLATPARTAHATSA